jgi:hypothetical protein
MYGWDAFVSMESLAKPSTRTAERLLAVSTCLLHIGTAAREPSKRQQGRWIQREPIMLQAKASEPNGEQHRQQKVHKFERGSTADLCTAPEQCIAKQYKQLESGVLKLSSLTPAVLGHNCRSKVMLSPCSQ